MFWAYPLYVFETTIRLLKTDGRLFLHFLKRAHVLVGIFFNIFCCSSSRPMVFPIAAPKVWSGA